MLPILFRSIDQGAPVLNNAAGAMISVLDACLVTGFNTLNVTSLVVASNICTVTTAVAHGLSVDQRMTIAGAATTSLNGDKTITAVPTTTTFTFSVTQANTSETPGSCTAKRTSLGWVKEYTGTNKAIYKMSDVQSYGQMLRVEDSSVGIDARIFGVESATSVDSYTDKFPTEAQTAGGMYVTKGANSTTPKFWAIIGDGRFFYMVTEGSARFTAYSTTLTHAVWCFGDIISFKPGEAYGSFICAPPSTTSSYAGSDLTIGTALGSAPNANSIRLCRSHTALNKSVFASGYHAGSTIAGFTGPVYPSPIDNGLVLASPSFIIEALPYASNPIRGILPGFVTPMCASPSLSDIPYGEIITTTDGQNRKVILFKNTVRGGSSADSACAFDLSRPWR